jgi:hypothetical protein
MVGYRLQHKVTTVGGDERRGWFGLAAGKP